MPRSCPPGHRISYPCYTKAAAQRRNNVRRSRGLATAARNEARQSPRFAPDLTSTRTTTVIWNPNGVTISNGLMFVVLSSAAGSLGAILMKQIKGVQALQFQAWAGLSAILPLGLASALFESGQVSTTLAGGLKLLGCVAFSALVRLGDRPYGLLLADQPLRANMIAPLILMSLVFTVVLGVLLLGDRLDLRMIVGAAITLIGVLIIALRPNRAMPRALLIRERM
jgi:O-acetylserine/cysteine efflux transporter